MSFIIGDLKIYGRGRKANTKTNLDFAIYMIHRKKYNNALSTKACHGWLQLGKVIVVCGMSTYSQVDFPYNCEKPA